MYFLRFAPAQALVQIPDDLFDHAGAWTRENKQIFRAFAGRGENDQVFRKKFRFMRDHRTVEFNRLGKGPSILARDKVEFARFFVCRDKRTK
jgi:hypothetical protein